MLAGFGLWRGLFRKALAACAVLVLAAGCSTTGETLDAMAPPPGPPTKYSALVIDASSGATLYQSNATATRYPASLTKMMTLYLLFEALDQGRVSKTTEIPVSAYARPPAADEDRPQDRPVDRCRERHPGADGEVGATTCAVAVAEYLGGTEEQFAAQMTAGRASSA